jgi:hypothetical protein
MSVSIEEVGMGTLTPREVDIARRAVAVHDRKLMDWFREQIEAQHRTSYRQGWDDGFKVGAVDDSTGPCKEAK